MAKNTGALSFKVSPVGGCTVESVVFEFFYPFSKDRICVSIAEAFEHLHNPLAPPTHLAGFMIRDASGAIRFTSGKVFYKPTDYYFAPFRDTYYLGAGAYGDSIVAREQRDLEPGQPWTASWAAAQAEAI